MCMQLYYGMVRYCIIMDVAMNYHLMQASTRPGSSVARERESETGPASLPPVEDACVHAKKSMHARKKRVSERSVAGAGDQLRRVRHEHSTRCPSVDASRLKLVQRARTSVSCMHAVVDRSMMRLHATTHPPCYMFSLD